MTPPGKTYLGDGVYVEADRDGTFCLTTENGVTTSNVIFLEPEVYRALAAYAEAALKAEG